MRTIIRRISLVIALIFILPGLLHLGLWSVRDRPSSWRNADWTSANIFPTPVTEDASIYVLAARTGGIKGAFATHSWIVLKKPGENHYDRYDVVGWGTPVRKNAWEADGRWYSNTPNIQFALHGEAAVKLLPKIENAIATYRWNKRGDYRLWPGPNSNTFVASISRAVPGFEATTPSTAVGRDFPEDGRWLWQTDDGTWRASLAGYAGMVIGWKAGLEINFLGLVAGINPAQRKIKVPAFGTYQF